MEDYSVTVFHTLVGINFEMIFLFDSNVRPTETVSRLSQSSGVKSSLVFVHNLIVYLRDVHSLTKLPLLSNNISNNIQLPI